MTGFDSSSSSMAHLARNGLHPKAIRWDGEPLRFPGRNQQRGDNGRYVAFASARGDVYGDWRDPEDRHHHRLASVGGAPARAQDQRIRNRLGV